MVTFSKMQAYDSTYRAFNQVETSHDPIPVKKSCGIKLIAASTLVELVSIVAVAKYKGFEPERLYIDEIQCISKA